jgi:hypothetical protein
LVQRFKSIVYGSIDSGGTTWQQEHVATRLSAQEAERRRDFKVKPMYLLPPARLHLLKFPPPPKIAPLSGDQTFNNDPMLPYFIFKQ